MYIPRYALYIRSTDRANGTRPPSSSVDFRAIVSDADRDVRRAVPAVRRLLRAECDAAVRVQRQARGVRAQRQHEPVREIRTGPGSERDLRLGGAAHQGGDRGGRQARRRHRVQRRRGRGGGRGRRPQTQPRLPGRRRVAPATGRQTVRRAVATGDGTAVVGNVQEPVRSHHGRRRGQNDDGVPEEQQTDPGRIVRRQRQMHRTQSLFAFGQLFSRTGRRLRDQTSFCCGARVRRMMRSLVFGGKKNYFRKTNFVFS